jgi:iron(III) transport system permease protein
MISTASAYPPAAHRKGTDVARRWLQNAALLEPLFYVQLVVIVLLCMLVVYPAVIVLASSFDDNGAFSLRWFIQAYSSPRNVDAIVNTVLIASGASLFATISGTLLAWVTSRTDVPARWFIELAAVVPFISTSFIGALAWILLGSPETGLINQLWRYLGGDGALINVYSYAGVIFVIGLHEIPFVFLLVGSALRSMDPALEEASLSAGAGQWRTTFRVTFPVVLPAILASALLVFVLAAEQFGVPAVLGSPAKIRVLTTSIIETQVVYPPRQGLGAALCVTLLAFALLGLWLYNLLLGKRSYATIGGKGAQPKRIRLGALRWVVSAVCVLYLSLVVILPLITIFLSSIRTIWTADFRWEQFTLYHYYWVLFDYPIARRAIVNSLLLASVGATVGMLFCVVIAFLSQRTRLPGRKLLDYLSMLPLGFPGVVLAFGLLQAWISPPIVLYGTIWILLVAYITRELPVGVRVASATIVQIHPELEEASRSCGGSWLQTFRKVTLPLLKSGILAGWFVLFVAMTRELSASILLYSPRREVLSVAIYDMFYDGNFRALSALASMQVAIALCVLGLARWTARAGRKPE